MPSPGEDYDRMGEERDPAAWVLLATKPRFLYLRLLTRS